MARGPKPIKEEKGRISITQMREMINKKAGTNVAFDLTQDNPSDVTEWISTGSHVLDSIICRGKKAGIPVGRITELAGLEASGKSYLAAQIAANAQKQGFDVVYFDSESSLDSDFLEKAGCDVGNIIYAQATSIEFVLETIEDLLGSNQNKMLFILDSFAFTPCLADINGDFNPQSSMAMKPRIMSKGLTKLIQPIANSGSAFLVLNQLKQNIVTGPTAHVEMMMNPFIVPGGKALAYAYSLRIWLTARKSKSSYVISENGYRIGSETKCTLKKSRFGTEGRECSIKLLWGGDRIHVQDEDAWMEVLKGSEHVTVGPWWTIKYSDGSVQKFRSADFYEELANNKFRTRVVELVEEELITKFSQQKGNAAAFYNIDSDGDVVEATEE
jgi:recombination protein RecA